MPMVASRDAECAGRDAPITIDGVLLYEERSLVRVGGLQPSSRVPRLLTTLCEAPGSADRERAVRSELQAIDIDWLEYGRLQCREQTFKPLSLLHTYGPPTWAATYCTRRFWQCDTRLRRAPPACLPSLWTVADERCRSGEALGAEPTGRDMLNAMADCGIGSGVTICLALPDAGHTVAIHFLSKHPHLRWATEEATSAALLLGVCLNEFISRHTLPVAPKSLHPVIPDMSALQSRVADCVSRGYSDKEVARSLALSRHTVDYHLRALRHRFNVRNRVQLAQAIGAMREASVIG